MANSFDLCTRTRFKFSMPITLQFPATVSKVATGTANIIHVYIMDSANIAVTATSSMVGAYGVYV